MFVDLMCYDLAFALILVMYALVGYDMIWRWISLIV